EFISMKGDSYGLNDRALLRVPTDDATRQPTRPGGSTFNRRQGVRIRPSLTAARPVSDHERPRAIDPVQRDRFGRGEPDRSRSAGMLAASRTLSSAAATSNGASVTSSGQVATISFAHPTQRAVIT